MKTAQPFDRDNTTVFQHRHRRAQRSLTGSGVDARAPFQRWPAVRAGCGLGVKTSIGWVTVFRLTRQAEGKCGH